MKGTEMKTICSGIFLSFLIILHLVTPVIGSSDDWVEYYRYNNGTIVLYNKVHIKNDIVQVWNKIVFSVVGREEYIQKMRHTGMSDIEWDKFSHTLILYEIDCKNRRSQIVSDIEYKTDGSVLLSRSSDEPNWTFIPPDTGVDILQKIVCK
jgi:hypothetical protein